MSINQLSIDSDRTGLFSDEKTQIFPHQSVFERILEYDPEGQIIFQCQYYLERENIKYRKSFLTILDVIIEFGGLSKGLLVIAGIMISPIYYEIQSIHFYSGLLGQ